MTINSKTRARSNKTLQEWPANLSKSLLTLFRVVLVGEAKRDITQLGGSESLATGGLVLLGLDLADSFWYLGDSELTMASDANYPSSCQRVMPSRPLTWNPPEGLLKERVCQDPSVNVQVGWFLLAREGRRQGGLVGLGASCYRATTHVGCLF